MMFEKRTPSARRFQLPLFGKELAAWLFISLTPMPLALPVSLWLNRGCEDDVLKRIRSVAAAQAGFCKGDSRQASGIMPALPME